MNICFNATACDMKLAYFLLGGLQLAARWCETAAGAEARRLLKLRVGPGARSERASAAPAARVRARVDWFSAPAAMRWAPRALFSPSAACSRGSIRSYKLAGLSLRAAFVNILQPLMKYYSQDY